MNKKTRKLAICMCACVATFGMAFGGVAAFSHEQAVSVAAEETTNTPTVEYSCVETYHIFEGRCDTFIRFSANLDGASGAAEGTNYAATSNATSLGVKLNGKTFYELYQENPLFHIYYGYGGNIFCFIVPDSYLTATAEYPEPVLTIDEGTPFMNSYLPAVEVRFNLTASQWYESTETPDVPDTPSALDFVSSRSSDPSDGWPFYGVYLEYNTSDFIATQEQVAVSGSTGFAFNGEANNITNIVFNGNAAGENDELLFWLLSDKCVADYNGYSHPTLAIAEGATVTNAAGQTFTLKALTLYLVDGAWTTTKPDGYTKPGESVTPTQAAYNCIHWNNVGYNDYQDGNGLFDSSKQRLILVQYTDGFMSDETGETTINENIVKTSDVGNTITLDGKPIKDLDGARVALYYGYMMIVVPYGNTLVIGEGTDFYGYSLAEKTFYFDPQTNAWSETEPTVSYSHVTFTQINSDWNNRANVGGRKDTILEFSANLDGAEGVGVATNFAATSNATSLNVKLNGKTFSALYKENQTFHIYYGHGKNFFCFIIPDEYLVGTDEYRVPVLTIEENTPFMMSYLPKLTLYLYQGAWTTEKPDVLEKADEEYTTITDLFGKAEATINGAETLESETAVSGNVVYNFLLKNDAYDDAVIFSTHATDPTDEADGVKVVFTKSAEAGKELVTVFAHGEDIGSGTYAWTADEWFYVRVAVTIGDTLSVSVAIDGVFLVRADGLSVEGLGSQVGLIGNTGKITVADYRKGDIKKPKVEWHGKDTYRFESGAEVPADEIFRRSMTITDNDGDISLEKVQVVWQDGAVTDGKLNAGDWTVTLSVSDKAGNVTKLTISVIVSDSRKATITFDGAATETTYHIGDLLQQPSDPVKVSDDKNEYTFDGWYVGDVKWDFANDVVKGDTALTAKFIATAKIYTVKIVGEGLAQGYEYTFRLIYGAELSKDLLARDGYTYKLYLGEAEQSSLTATGDVTYRVVYTVAQTGDSSGDTQDSSGDTQDSSNGTQNSSSDKQDSSSGAQNASSDKQNSSSSAQNSSSDKQDASSSSNKTFKLGCFGSISALPVASLGIAIAALLKKKKGGK